MPGGNLTIELLAFVSATFAFAGRAQEQRLRAGRIPVFALIAIAALGAVQLIPMSPEMLRRVSPTSAHVYDEANNVLNLFVHRSIPSRISIAPTETRSTILLTLAYAAAFTSAALVVSTRVRRRILVAVFLGSATIQIALALATEGFTDRLHGAFVNSNHFAGYLEMAIAFGFGLIWAEVLTNSDRVKGIGDRGERVEKRALPFIWRAAVCCVLAGGLAFTRSRGGLLAVAATMIALLAMGVLHRRTTREHRRAALVIIAALVIGVTVLMMTAGRPALVRFIATDVKDARHDFRVQVWSGSIDAWRMFPHFGSGLGTFREVFRRVQPREITGLVEQAHNDFLQLLVTGGWIGAALGLIAFGSVYAILMRGWLQQQHREESAFILAALGALFSLTLHGLVDFNMSLPANPATLAILLGAATAATHYPRKLTET